MGRQDVLIRTDSAVGLRRHRETGAPGPDWFELAVLVLFAATSMWLIALNLWYAAHQHLVWTGIDGEFPIDQLQYLAWIKDASHHVLISDLFLSSRTPHDYLQPMIAISGGLTAAGLAPWLSLLFWKPVALVAGFVAIRAYCHRLLPTRAQRIAGLLLALFAGWFGVLANEWLPFQSWGYPFDLMSVAALIGALITYEADRTRVGLARMAAPFLGALTSWLHPWQGEVLIVLVIGSEARRSFVLARAGEWPSVGRAGVRPWRAAGLVSATALPLIYYAALGHFDPAWATGRASSQLSWPLGEVILPLLPLLVLALPAYTRRPSGFLGFTARLWPVAALLVWAVNEAGLGAWSVYAWVGISVPLGVLVVESADVVGLTRIPYGRLVTGLVVTALIIPGSFELMNQARTIIRPRRSDMNLISHSESRALAYLAADRLPGSVLSPFPLGDAVPAETGRQTFVGDNRWSPKYGIHNRRTWKLMHGLLSPATARRFVRRSHAQFILAPCGSRDLSRKLGKLVAPVRRFGCLRLYLIR